MALTELQRPNKDTFYRNIQNLATEMDKLMVRWRDAIEFIDMVGASDLDAMGVPAGTSAGTVRADMLNFRTLLNEMISLYDGNTIAPANIPSEVIDRVRHM